MNDNHCTHEETLSYGITVYHDAVMRVVQVMCDDCHGYGTVVETWSDDDNDYTESSETWHSYSDYRAY